MVNVTRRDLKRVHRRVATVLSKREEVLAVEFLQHEKIFGYHAKLTEMSSFKTKVKKQAVEYDPEEVHRREAAERKEIAEKDRKLREEQKEEAKRQEKAEESRETGEATFEKVDFEMKKEEGLMFTETHKEELQDLTHLWKQDGNMMVMRTQEEYEADMKKEEEQLLKDEL
uniref:Uncharacterized protein n=1 Tax=Strombidium inclinatum TaxID=197538 RepID=A0A7S3IWL0_9SPIT|mmetsp:Transcript_6150/g.9887  ORF Transcript_6150/g.9887 Transcript_6150/m.9887 type:complete len:171 (+) Transcript_6150:404-916(+)